MLKRRSFFGKLVAAAGAMGLTSMPTLAAQKQDKIPGRFMHMVFFWLNEGVDKDEFIKTTEAFIKQVDEVKSYHLGKPAGTRRDVVDNTYSVSLVVTFDTKEDQDIYQNHAVHVQYVKNNGDKWNRVQIYDSWGAN